MLELQNSDIKKFSATNRLIILECIRRSWRVYVLEIPSGHLYIDRGDGDKKHIFSSCPPSVSYADGVISNDKWLTYQTLMHGSISQPRTELIHRDSSEDEMKLLIDELQRVVVKPRDASHGKGVTVGVTGISDFKQAVTFAMQHNISAKSVIVQSQFSEDNRDLRILCIDFVFKAAIHRVPARVYGDGHHTIRELIDDENTRTDRGLPYQTKLATIDKERAEVYLGSKIDSIPSEGQEISVLGIANYGAGGETIDVTDSIPGWLRREAEQVAKTLGLNVAGVDYLTTNLKVISELEAGGSDVALLEVNKAPALCIHDEPTEGSNRHTVEAYLDLIASL